MNVADELLTVNELAERLRVRPRYVYRLVRHGLPCLRIGCRGFLRFEFEHVVKWLRDQQACA